MRQTVPARDFETCKSRTFPAGEGRTRYGNTVTMHGRKSMRSCKQRGQCSNTFVATCVLSLRLPSRRSSVQDRRARASRSRLAQPTCTLTLPRSIGGVSHHKERCAEYCRQLCKQNELRSVPSTLPSNPFSRIISGPLAPFTRLKYAKIGIIDTTNQRVEPPRDVCV